MTEQATPDVGLHVRAYRTERGLSLRALAALCDLSANTISLIERGVTSPSVSTLHRLSIALGVPIAAFFVEQGDEVKIVLTRADERPRSGSASVLLESLGSGLEDQACEPFIVTLKPGATSGRQEMVHEGQELVYCLQGTLDYEIDGEHYRLDQGDALLFRADLSHRWKNPGSEPSIFLMMMQVTPKVHESVNQHLHP